MASQKFKPGSVVVLLSGGPPMTVIKYEGEEVICQWFNKQTREEKAFPQEALKIYVAPHGVIRLK